MRYQSILGRAAQEARSLASDFGFIFAAIADAFRALASALRSCCEPLHYAGWR